MRMRTTAEIQQKSLNCQMVNSYLRTLYILVHWSVIMPHWAMTTIQLDRAALHYPVTSNLSPCGRVTKSCSLHHNNCCLPMEQTAIWKYSHQYSTLNLTRKLLVLYTLPLQVTMRWFNNSLCQFLLQQSVQAVPVVKN